MRMTYTQETIISHFFKQKYKIFTGCCFSHVKRFCVIYDGKLNIFRFGPLIGQNETFEEITLEFMKL